MAYTTVLDAIPSQIVNGDSYSWTYSNSTYPYTSSWRLTYTLVKSGVKIQIVATGSGADHLVEIPGTTTDDYTVGEYDWQAHITNGTERYMVLSGVLEVVADFATQTSGLDARSHTKIVLDALEAAIEGRASKTQLKQSVGEGSVEHMTLSEQVRMRDIYYGKYQRELILAGKKNSRHQVKVRFV